MIFFIYFFSPKKSRDIFILSETVLNSEMLKKERHSLVPDTEWERHPLTPKDCNFVPIYNIFRSIPPSSPKTTEILSMETYLNLTLFKTLKFYEFRISIIAISFSYCNSDIDFVPALLPAMGWGVFQEVVGGNLRVFLSQEFCYCIKCGNDLFSFQTWANYSATVRIGSADRRK